MPKTCIIFNPTARGEKALKFRRELDALHGRLTLKPTDAPGAAIRLAAEAVSEGFERVVAAGGDGTVNEVLNGLLSARSSGSNRIPSMAVLPLGTVNVFARELGIPLKLSAALQVLDEGVERTVDVLSVEFQQTGKPALRYFAQLGGAGLDSRAIARVDWNLKKKLGPLAYVVAGFQALRASHPPVRASSRERSESGGLVLLGNGRYYGGHFVLFPLATLTDGKLDVTVFPKAGLGALLRFGAGWLTGDAHRFGGTISWQTEAVTLECDVPTPFELDGDNLGMLPAVFRPVPSALTVVVPR